MWRTTPLSWVRRLTGIFFISLVSLHFLYFYFFRPGWLCEHLPAQPHTSSMGFPSGQQVEQQHLSVQHTVWVMVLCLPSRAEMCNYGDTRLDYRLCVCRNTARLWKLWEGLQGQVRADRGLAVRHEAPPVGQTGPGPANSCLFPAHILSKNWLLMQFR